jgi:adenine deaminase
MIKGWKSMINILSEIIQAARGEKESDLLLTNGKIINVFSGDVQNNSIAISSGYIVGFGDYPASETIDLKGQFVSPGFIDAHVHIESSMTCISEYAGTVIRHGTTTVVADPHEITNVLGIEGLLYMIESSKNQFLNVYFTFPSCVPATDMETSGANLMSKDVEAFMGHEKIVALGEMMNFPGVLYRDQEILAKIIAAKKFKKPLDGHSPGLTGKDLYAYLAAGISSDHECTEESEGREKLLAGMHVIIREGTAARNLHALIPLINDRTVSRLMWCTDDRHPHELTNEGSIDAIVREAIRSGVDPINAIKMATISAADYFGLNDIGAIAPGRRADLVIFEDLNCPETGMVFSSGKLIVKDGQMLSELDSKSPVDIPTSMNVDLSSLDFSIPAEGKHARVIEIIPNQIITRQIIVEPSIKNHLAQSDVRRDILKIAVVERHKKTGNIGKGFVRGLGLKRGAIASSVAHDSHNIIVAGVNDFDMVTAVHALIRMGGGLVVACDNKIISSLELPIAGLMSFDPAETVRNKLDDLIRICHDLGTTLKDPFMTLSFLALPVIPELKLTDKGLVDVGQFAFVSLFVS